MTATKRHVGEHARIMPDEMRDLLDKLGLSQVGAARFLDRDERNVRRYLAGDLPLPAEIAMLLALMVKTKTTPEQVRKIAKLPAEF